MRSPPLFYYSTLLLCLCVCGLAGCSQKDKGEAVENTESAVQKAYDKTRQVLKNVAEGINDAVYK